jgi:hypothetical protein
MEVRSMGTQDKTQGQGQMGQGPDWNKDKTKDQAWNKEKTQDWNKENPDMERGDQTKPPQPEGTTPLERDQRPINQSR